MPHEKIALRTERDRRNGRVQAEEALVIGVVGNTIVSGRIIVHEAEIVCRAVADCGLDVFSKGIEAGRDRTRGVLVFGRGVLCFGVDGDEGSKRVRVGIIIVTRRNKYPRLVNPKDSREPRRVDLHWLSAALDTVLDAVEGQFATKKVEQVACC